MARIPSCALDETGLREQRDRYAALAPSVSNLKKQPEALLVEFGEGFDRELLERALAVERECCPFFQFDLDESKRRLGITVAEREQLPALDAIAAALGAEG
jgi:hypothetical protein